MSVAPRSPELRAEIARRRLAGQHLTKPVALTPSELVARLGAVQAQDYSGAKWALGQRLAGATDVLIERAMTEGTILRTHVLRPTWHFVAPHDIRWMLALTAPRVNAVSSYQFRKLELDDAVFRRSNAALTKALRDGKQLTRDECAAVLQRARIDTTAPQRLGYLLIRAELDAVICGGARRGKQFTYALLDERVPPAKPMSRDEALAELAVRYFTSRGPATIHDYAWWSGLTIADAKRGVQAAGVALDHLTLEGQPYWRIAGARLPRSRGTAAHLLPNYDEYFIGFRDRSALQGRVDRYVPDDPSSPFAGHVVVIGGQLVGGWKRTLEKKSVVVEVRLVDKPRDGEREAIVAEVKRYGAFLGLAATVQAG